MVVHHDPSDWHFKIIVFLQKPYPDFLSIRIEVSGFVVTANLKVAPIFTKTHAKLALLNNFLFEHHVVDGLETV